MLPSAANMSDLYSLNEHSRLGADNVPNYEEVIRSIQYVHRHPENLNSRVFTLTCSELNGRFVSNTFRINVSASDNVRYHSCR